LKEAELLELRSVCGEKALPVYSRGGIACKLMVAHISCLFF